MRTRRLAWPPSFFFTSVDPLRVEAAQQMVDSSSIVLKEITAGGFGSDRLNAPRVAEYVGDSSAQQWNTLVALRVRSLGVNLVNCDVLNCCDDVVAFAHGEL
jgi:hypothetical protein